MNRMWRGPDREPTEAAPVAVGPRSTVPHHRRLRDRLIELYGLDDGCSDDRIYLAALEHSPPARPGEMYMSDATEEKLRNLYLAAGAGTLRIIAPAARTAKERFAHLTNDDHCLAALDRVNAETGALHSPTAAGYAIGFVAGWQERGVGPAERDDGP